MENEPGPLDSDDGAPGGARPGLAYPHGVGAWKSTVGSRTAPRTPAPYKCHHDKKRELSSVCLYPSDRDGVQGAAPWGFNLQPGVCTRR